MVIGLTLLVALIGVLMYALCANPKLTEVGRIMFFCGLLAFLLGGARMLVELAK
jgi:Na+/phosphate symporter